MGTRDSIRRAANAIADNAEAINLDGARTVLTVVALSLAVIACTLVTGVILYAARH